MPDQIRAFGVWDAEAAWRHLGCDERQRRLALLTLEKLAPQMEAELSADWRAGPAT